MAFRTCAMSAPPLTIRRYQPSDWPDIAEVHDAARLDELRASVGVDAFLSLAQTAESEGLFEGELWVAQRDSKVIGFVAFTPEELTWLYVAPAQYRQGVGRSLLAHALSRCAAVFSTEVLAGNDAALGLYLASGFRIARRVDGRLTGNDAFAASGDVLTWSRPEAAPAKQP